MPKTRERFKMAIAVHLLLERDGKILFLRRANTGYEDGKLSVPAGHVDEHESATSAMVREAREELGIQVPAPVFAHVAHKRDPVDGQERIDFFFRCAVWEGEPRNMEPEKCSGLEWYPSTSLPPDVIAYVRSAIENLNEDRAFSEFGWE